MPRTQPAFRINTRVEVISSCQSKGQCGVVSKINQNTISVRLDSGIVSCYNPESLQVVNNTAAIEVSVRVHVGRTIPVIPVARQPVVRQPVIRQPVIRQPVIRQPVIIQPVIIQPVLLQPVPSRRRETPVMRLSTRHIETRRTYEEIITTRIEELTLGLR